MQDWLITNSLFLVHFTLNYFTFSLVKQQLKRIGEQRELMLSEIFENLDHGCNRPKVTNSATSRQFWLYWYFPLWRYNKYSRPKILFKQSQQVVVKWLGEYRLWTKFILTESKVKLLHFPLLHFVLSLKLKVTCKPVNWRSVTFYGTFTVATYASSTNSERSCCEPTTHCN